VELSFPVVVSVIVVMLLTLLIANKCYQQAMVNRQHRNRLDREMYAKMNPEEYFGEEASEEEGQYRTKFTRHAKSSFQTRKERETRLEAALVKAQIMAEGYDTGEQMAVF